MQGVVKSWGVYKRSRKRYGYIEGMDRKTYFFRDSDCIDYQGFEKGDNVVFATKGEKAINVRKCSM